MSDHVAAADPLGQQQEASSLWSSSSDDDDDDDDDDDEKSSQCDSSSSSDDSMMILVKSKDVSWSVDGTTYTAQLQVTSRRIAPGSGGGGNYSCDRIQNVEASLFAVDQHGVPVVATGHGEPKEPKEKQEGEKDKIDQHPPRSSVGMIGTVRGTILPRDNHDDDDDDDEGRPADTTMSAHSTRSTSSRHRRRHLQPQLPPPPPHWGFFYRWADSISSELLRLAMMFCDRNGAAVRIATTNSSMSSSSDENIDGGREDGDFPNDEQIDHHHHVHHGGFLHVQVVTVDVAHKGRDVGLRLLHEVLVFLRPDWSLLVMEVSPLMDELRERLHHLCNQNNHDTPADSASSPRRHDTDVDIGDAEQQQQVLYDQAELKLARHLARLHLRQAGRCAEEYCAWYVTSATYFGAAPEVVEKQHEKGWSSSSSPGLGWWKTKAQADLLDVYVPPQPHQSMGIDLTLRRLLEEQAYCGTMACRTVVAQMERLVVDQGASVHDSRALFVLLAFSSSSGHHHYHQSNHYGHCDHKSKNNAVLFQTLLRLGADVDRADEYGNRPLHHVVLAEPQECTATLVQQLRPSDLRLLLEQGGADPHVVNDQGDTPLQSLQRGRQKASDWVVVIGGRRSSSYSTAAVLPSFSPRNALDYLDCCTALLPVGDRTLLVDGWMSPLMRYMLHKTARCARMDIQHCAATTFPSSTVAAPLFNTKRSLHECTRRCTTGSRRTQLQDDSATVVPLISYISTDSLRNHCADGLTKSYVDGWALVWEAIERIIVSSSSSSTLRCGQQEEQQQQRQQPMTTIATPTIAKVQQEILFMNGDGSSTTTSDILPEPFVYFLAEGGQIEFALDALLSVTMQNNLAVQDTQHNCYCYSADDDKKMAALPAVPCLDMAFDVARAMCFAINHATAMPDEADDEDDVSAADDSAVLPRGPYRHNFGPTHKNAVYNTTYGSDDDS